MHPTNPDLIEPVVAEPPVTESESVLLPPPEKKSKRTLEGRARSSQNAVKHGSCAATLILPGEDEEGWRLLLARWRKQYHPQENTLEYDFVLRTAQAEWHRLRNQFNYDSFLLECQGATPKDWTPEQIKKHDLLLRYRTAAERNFQREYRTLEQHIKTHRPTDKTMAQPAPPPEQQITRTQITCADPTSPTGYLCLDEIPTREGVTYPYPIAPPPPTPTSPSEESAGTLEEFK